MGICHADAQQFLVPRCAHAYVLSGTVLNTCVRLICRVAIVMCKAGAVDLATTLATCLAKVHMGFGS